MKAWVYQDPKQVKKVGESKASWYVGWLEPDGKRRCKSCGAKSEGKRNAEKLRQKLTAQLIAGTYESESTATWETFRQEYEERILPRMAMRSREEVIAALNHFQRVINPKKMIGVKTATIDTFIAKRRSEKGKKGGSKVSPATINKDLRHIRAAMATAQEWGYLPELPRFHMEPVPKKIPTYVSSEHFAAIYKACEHARFPTDLPYRATAWWRGLLVFAYMTGWRISEILSLKREDLDLEKGIALTCAEDNKGKRDDRVGLHPVVVEHLRAIPSFDPFVFSWDHYKTTLYAEFASIQEKAGIRLPCRKEHQHTRYCHVYGFHDFRRAFATMNAARLTPDALQALMRHRSYSTTQLYINTARQMDKAVADLHVPEVLREKKA